MARLMVLPMIVCNRVVQNLSTRCQAQETESRTARRAATSVSIARPNIVAVFTPAPPAIAELKQRLQPLDLLLCPVPAPPEGAAVIFLALLPC